MTQNKQACTNNIIINSNLNIDDHDKNTISYFFLGLLIVDSSCSHI